MGQLIKTLREMISKGFCFVPDTNRFRSYLNGCVTGEADRRSAQRHIFIDEAAGNNYNIGLSGETGENPVRARRRKAYNKLLT